MNLGFAVVRRNKVGKRLASAGRVINIKTIGCDDREKI